MTREPACGKMGRWHGAGSLRPRGRRARRTVPGRCLRRRGRPERRLQGTSPRGRRAGRHQVSELARDARPRARAPARRRVQGSEPRPLQARARQPPHRADDRERLDAGAALRRRGAVPGARMVRGRIARLGPRVAPLGEAHRPPARRGARAPRDGVRRDRPRARAGRGAPVDQPEQPLRRASRGRGAPDVEGPRLRRLEHDERVHDGPHGSAGRTVVGRPAPALPRLRGARAARSQRWARSGHGRTSTRSRSS